MQNISHRNVNTTSNIYCTILTLHKTCQRRTLVKMSKKVVCYISRQPCSHEKPGLMCYIAIVLHLARRHGSFWLRFVRHVNFGIIFLFIANSKSYLQSTQSILIGCFTFSQEYCKRIGLNWKLMRRQLWASTCHIDRIRHFSVYFEYFSCQILSA